MFARLSVLFCLALTATGLRSEVQVPFDGKVWVFPEGYEDEMLKDGVCFTADANVPAGIAFKDMGLDQFLTHPVRFALRGQEGDGAVLDVLPADKMVATSLIVVFHGEGVISAGCFPVDHATGVPPADFRSASMSDDFEGLEDFLGVVKDGVKKAEAAKEVPRVALVVRSKTSFGLVVRLLQFVRSVGCATGLVRVDDEFPGFDFKVSVDPDVLPPVAKVSNGKGSERGRIVVNILADGTLKDAENRLLADETAVKDYVGRERVRIEGEGIDPKLHLRGEQDSVFKYSRIVIRSAAEAGVDQVVFAVYQVPEPKADDFLDTRETDLNISLPKSEAGEDESRVTVDLSVDAKGRLWLTGEDGFLDTDAAVRELPLLKAKLKIIAGEKGIGEKELKVMVRVDPLTAQQRVIDVLNLLAQMGISSVTFGDPKAEGGE